MSGKVEDLVVHILNTPLSTEDICDLKDKRPTPHLKLVQIDANLKRNFQFSWYKEFPWLTGSLTNCKLYCYECLLFGGDGEWTKEGVQHLKNFHRKARKHQISKAHISNSERFQLLGKCRVEDALTEAARLSALKHNESVSHNRRLMGRLIQVVCYLGRQELAFDCDEGQGNYAELLELLGQEEQFVRERLEFNGTSPCLQNDLVECITRVVNEEIRKELDNSEFVCLQVDETLDVSCGPQMSVTFRYYSGSSVRERFVGFYDAPKDKSASTVSEVVLNVLREWGVDKKLICQTYDGALAMAGEVQSIIKQECPLAMFVHSFAHNLNLVLLHCSKTIKKVRLFVYDLAAFGMFFSKSSKRTQILSVAVLKLVHFPIAEWDFHTRAIETIVSHFMDLKAVLVQIIDNDEEWDAESFNGATELLKRMEDPTFVFLLCLYNKIFCLADDLLEVLQTNCTSHVNNCIHKIKQTISQLKNLRNEETVSEFVNISRSLNRCATLESFPVPALQMLTYEIIDTLVVQMEIRFGDFETFDFVELLDENQFTEYDRTFPLTKLKQLLNMYPFFESEQLKNELTNVYSDKVKYLPPQGLLQYITNNGLEKIYEQTSRLIRLVLTFPITCSNEMSNCTNLINRIKTFLKNSMKDARVSQLSTLAIEKSLLNELSRDQRFRDRVIDLFADKTNYCMDLIYKKV